MPDSPVRVLLVDDSPLALAILKRALETVPDITVVGTARNGKEALAMVPRLDPQVICTDYYMPQMDGLEFVRQVMARFPRPILVVSSASGPELGALLSAGALELHAKPPTLGTNVAADRLIAERLIHRIRVLAGVPMISRQRSATVAATVGGASKRDEVAVPRALAPKIVVIGASTGGPQVLRTIFSKLPAVYPVPILCVQHISKGFQAGLIEWLSAASALPIVVATAGETPRAGVIHFPEEGAHLKIDDSGRLAISHEPSGGSHCPSISVTFRSIAQHYGKNVTAVLLTGMGSDGADGMKAVRGAGGVTITQDEASCAVFGMPKAAIDLGAAEFVLDPERIASALARIASAKRS